MEVRITGIKPFAVHDGDGIRTTVFFKGCPLRCRWCHNPETFSPRPQLAFYPHKCLRCGACARVCPCHSMRDGEHLFRRDECRACGRCADVCPGEALELLGRETTTRALCAALLKDRDFYAESGGGITLSGGECLMQSAACREILKTMKENGIHTAVDTCGFVPRQAIDAVLPYTDLFLYDLKALDENVHLRCTGQPNRLILDNLRYLDQAGAAVEIRIPFVPGENDDQIPAIARYLSGLSCVTAVRVLPYHNDIASKYQAIGLDPVLPPRLPTAAELAEANRILTACDLRCK